MSRHSWAAACGVRAQRLAVLCAVLFTTAAAVWAQGVSSQPPKAPAVQKAAARQSGRTNAPRPANSRDDAPTAISRLALPPVRTVVFTEEREAAARAFVRRNRPELDAVLDQLQASKLTEYQQVICDLFRTSEMFATMQQEEPQRHALALKSWQVEAKTHLLAAELAGHPSDSDRIKTELRKTVEELADLQIAQGAYEVRRLEAKVRRAEGQQKKLESRRNETVNERVEAILQAVSRLTVP